MYKRISIRFVNELAYALSEIAKKRGLSINAVVSEMAWKFVEEWKSKQNKQ